MLDRRGREYFTSWPAHPQTGGTRLLCFRSRAKAVPSLQLKPTGEAPRRVQGILRRGSQNPAEIRPRSDKFSENASLGLRPLHAHSELLQEPLLQQ